MSEPRQGDFLGRLAARAFDRATVVRPRLPSRFETGRDTGEPAPEPELEAATEPRGPAAFFETPAAPADASPTLEATPPNAISAPAVTPAVPESAPPSAATSRPAPRTTTQDSPAPRNVEPILPEPAAPRRKDTRTPRAIAEHLGPSPLAADAPTPTPIADAQATDEPLSRVQPTRRSDSPAPIAPRKSTNAPTVPTPAARKAALEPVTPRIAPAADPAPDRPREAAVAVEPTIRVTIGRIDIRASRPKPLRSRPAPKPAPPRVSLDDYLKRRQGGRR